jgi:hypothetical protein
MTLATTAELREFRAKEHRNGLEPNARWRSEAGLGSLVPRHGMSAALLAALELVMLESR